MNDEPTLHFGERAPYTWRHIEIDYPEARPILLDDVQIGAVLAVAQMFPGNIKAIEMHGIEIYPEYRRNGIAKAVVQMYLDQCDMLIGAITEDQPKPFWLHMGAHFRPIPLDAFGHTINTVHTDEPVFFFITDNPVAHRIGERIAEETPKMMLMFNSMTPEQRREILLQK